VQAHQLGGVEDGGQGVTQLVGEHGQKIILAPVRLLQLLGPAQKLLLHLLALADVAQSCPKRR
jgi:hypothetical protein